MRVKLEIRLKEHALISYRIGNDLSLEEVIELYRASTLGERRPVDDSSRMAAMLQHANLVVTAWDENLLVGISRSLTDFVYVTYLADLAVRVSHQRHGIGKELISTIRQFYYADVSAILVIIVGTVFLIDWLTEILRHKLLSLDGR